MRRRRAKAWAELRPVRRRGMVSIPVRAAGAVLDQRSMVPFLWIYALAAAAGSVLGLAVGRPLAGALAAPGITWAFFLSTAFWGRGSPAAARRAVMRAVAPDRAWAEERRRMHAAFRHPPIPLYGVAGWDGELFLGGWGTAGGRRTHVTAMTLGHRRGAPGEGPEVRVETSLPPPVDTLDVLADGVALEELGSPGKLRSDEERDEWERRVHESAAALNPFAAEITVDGRAVSFQVIESENAWSGLAEVGGCIVTIEARRVPRAEVALVTVGDVEPYIEGDPFTPD